VFFILFGYICVTKQVKLEKRLVLDLKILMYRNIDEIERLKKIKANSDKDMATTLQKLK